MKAVILAAGEGTRLRPFTTSEPKVMIPIANRPIIQYVVEALVKNGVREMAMVVGYKKERIMSYFGDGKAFGAKIEYIVQSKVLGQIGTGFALGKARDYVKDEFLVLAGDNVIEPSTLTDIVNKAKGSAIVVTESQNPSKYGVVLLSGDNIAQIAEKPSERFSNIISTGIYRFDLGIFDAIGEATKDGDHRLTSAVQRMIPRNRFEAIFTSGSWRDVVYPWDLPSANAEALAKVPQHTAGTVERGAHIKGTVSIGAGTVVSSGAHITGPVTIGENCELGPGVCISPETSIGDNVVLSPHVVLQQSLVMKNSFIGAGTMLSHSVVGEGVRIGPNCTADGEPAKVNADGELKSLETIGAMIGEGSVIGGNVSFRGGVIVGYGCRIAPGKTICVDLPNGSQVM
ncbi:MAG: bifunctional sugar-1-phosphate nucleotidylyltransferase/acetyltransferase [Methanobacteriota archaeon]